MVVILPQVDVLNLTDGKTDNPCTMPAYKMYGEDYALAPLDQAELDLFKAQFSELMSMPGSDDRKMMLSRIPQFILGLRAIKSKLNNTRFQGVDAPATGLGMSLIRPQFTKNNTPAASAVVYRTNWLQALTQAWADWIMDGAGTGVTLGKDFGLVVTHLKSLTSPTPFMTEARFTINRAQLLPISTRGLKLGDTENNVAIQPIPTMIIIPGATFYARARCDNSAIGTDDVELGGIVFGLGRALFEEVPTWLV